MDRLDTMLCAVDREGGWESLPIDIHMSMETFADVLRDGRAPLTVVARYPHLMVQLVVDDSVPPGEFVFVGNQGRARAEAIATLGVET